MPQIGENILPLMEEGNSSNGQKATTLLKFSVFQHVIDMIHIEELPQGINEFY